MKKILFALLFFPLLVFAQKNDFIDKIDDEAIRSLRFYPDIFSQNPSLLPPVVALGNNLLLEFDRLGTETMRYTVKIASCTADWQESQLMESEFLNTFNEFYIQDYESSFNTKIPYVHYRFWLKDIKASGNYVLRVFDDYGKQVICRRFMVYENLVGISSSFGNITGAEQAFRNQQIDFLINHNSLDIPNPMEQIKVVIRQNFRWENAITNLKPTFVKSYQRELVYNYFNMENTFQGGNEFRLFDGRSFQSRGINVDQLVLLPEGNQVRLSTDRNRNGMIYNRIFEDLDGQFYIQKLESAQHNAEADYGYFLFSLYAEEPANGKVILSGAFTDWEISQKYEMEYDNEEKMYKKQLLLKQGYYNYCYVLTDNFYQNADYIFWEGSHQLTKNSYEILVYYRPFGSRNEKLIAYKSFIKQ